MRNGMEVLYGSVWKNDSEITVRVDPLVPGGLHFRTLLDLWPVLRMNPLQELLPGGTCFLRAIAVNPKNLFRPEQSVGPYIPGPTARVTEPLRFGQICFAAPEVLGQELVLRNVYGAANVLFQVLVFDDRNTNAANVPDLTIGSHDALGRVERSIFCQDSLDYVCHGFAVLWVDTIQVFLNIWWFAGRIESVHPKEFGRPIVEAVGIEGPASHVGKTLPFGKMKLASLQLLGVAAELFFRRFALVDIQARSIPLDDVAVCIAKWHFPVEHPAVISICSADASFVLEDFPSRQAGSPYAHNSINVFRVNESGPIPAGHFIQSDP